MIVNKLPQLLLERGLSIRELARKSSITYTTIWAVVHSNRRSVQLGVLDAICQVLDAQPGDIYFVVAADGTSEHDQADTAPPAAEGERIITRPLDVQTGRSRNQPESGRDWRNW